MLRSLRLRNWAAFALVAVLAPAARSADKADKKASQEGITRQQADDILNELRQIRQLLEKEQDRNGQPAGPAHARLNLQGYQMMGNKDAPITMVEFTDYQCPFCQRFHVSTFPELKRNYIDTGKVRFYSRDLPLDSHSNALRAAQAARCAAEQGQFWTMRDMMVAKPDKLDMESILADAGSLRMDVKAFRACIESEKYKDAVQSDVVEAMKIGANGTPTFVVGKSTPDGVDGELMVGALPYAMFSQKLKDLEK